MSERIDAAAARLLGISRASGTEKGLAKDIRTVLDALTVAQGKALLSQPTPTAELVHRVSIYPVSEFAVADRLTIVAECSSCGRMGTWPDTFEGNRQAQSFARAHVDPELIYTTMPVLPAPSIADMVPGTTFTAHVRGFTNLVDWEVLPYVGGGVFARSPSSWRWCTQADIDPSTIRDITPPKETP